MKLSQFVFRQTVGGMHAANFSGLPSFLPSCAIGCHLVCRDVDLTLKCMTIVLYTFRPFVP